VNFASLAAAFRLMLSWVDAVSGWNPRPTGGGRMHAHRLRACVEGAVTMPWEMVEPIMLYMVQVELYIYPTGSVLPTCLWVA